MKKFLEGRPKLLLEDEKGEMAVHKVARQGDVAVVRLLLDTNGTKEGKLMMNWQDKAGKTPLHHAAEYGHVEMVSFLLAREIDYTLENSQGQAGARFKPGSEESLGRRTRKTPAFASRSGRTACTRR